jgi:Tol biopolymer transport system component
MAYNGAGDRVGLGIDIVKSDGTGLINLTNSLEDFYLWSPDGTRLAFVDNRAFQEYVSTMRIDGSDKRHLVEGDGPLYWSPDGEWLSYVSNDDSGVHIIRADGTGDKLVIPDIFVNPYGWLPDGQHLFFVRLDLNVVELATMAEETISSFAISRFGDQTVAWSPDGSMVAFIGFDPSIPNAPNDIYMVNRDGSGQRRLTDNPGKYQCFNWPF